MTQRLNYVRLSAESYKKLMELSDTVKHSSLSQQLIDLVFLRASQLNGCAFCVDMHSKEARLHGEDELRLHHLVIWHESPLFTEKERAALAWTEALTHLSQTEIDDTFFEETKRYFDEKELSDLTYAVATINAWNRLAAPFKATPGGADTALGLTNWRS